ncbi:RNA-binding S4 domain-containing protein [Candidatus Woesearchaeota archaeon]|nr:RNA-binding S4 domain-containing protein [Candidatus Woesearchaeota archaeon]
MPQIDHEGKPYIELCNFLKLKGLALTGGQAKIIIRNEQVKVNGVTETRNKLKLRHHDVVSYQNKTFKVNMDEL